MNDVIITETYGNIWEGAYITNVTYSTSKADFYTGIMSDFRGTYHVEFPINISKEVIK